MPGFFFLRLATAHRLIDQRKASELWVDRECNQSCELAAFLHYYSIDTEICFSEEPVGFVDLLYNKWQEYKSKLAGKGYSVIPMLISQPVREEKRGKIFISYASEDRATATTLVEVLETAGLDVWWDRKIEVARKWDEAIAHQIEEACVFVALLSRHTTDPSVAPGHDHSSGHSNRQISDRGMRNQLRLKKKIDDLQRQWELLNKKLSELNEQLILETRVEEKLRLRKLIDDEQIKLNQVEEQLKDMENQLVKVDSDTKEITGRNDDQGLAPANDQARPPDWVFHCEWNAAFDRNARFFALDREFIIPVYIDDVEWHSPGIEKFVEEKLQGVKALNGHPTNQLIERLRKLQRSYRRSLQR